MKPILKELIWMIGILLFSLLIYGVIVGNLAMDVNMHDTYIVGNGQINHPSFTNNIFSVFVGISFLIYLVRVSFNHFKNNTVNLALMIITGLGIFYFSTNIILYLTATNVGSVWFNHSKALILTYYFIKILLITVFGFTGFMTGKNFRNQSVLGS